jgi:hypothetical protein
MSKPIAFNGTGVQWFPVPLWLGDADRPGLLLDLSHRELRLFLLVLSEAGKNRELFVELCNADVMKRLGMNKDKGNSFAKVRKSLVARGLIATTRKKKSFIYHVTNPRTKATLETGRRWYEAEVEEDEGFLVGWPSNGDAAARLG